MYGDMSVVRADAAALRAKADAMRLRALSLKSQAGSVAWSSRAAVVFRAQIDVTANDLGRSAAALDEAANALIAHANAVDAVKALIRQAEQWVGDRLSEARTIANNVVKTVEDVAESALSGIVTVISVIATEVEKVFTVARYTLFGTEIPKAQVTKAKTIVTAVPSTPRSGSKDWLDLNNLFKANGW